MPDLSPYDLLLEDIVHGRLPDDVVELLAHAIVERLDREALVALIAQALRPPSSDTELVTLSRGSS